MAHMDVVSLGEILLLACLVAIGSRRVGLPYSVGLVIVGIGLGVSGHHSGIALTPELIFTFLLPPLIFEAALHLGWPQFRREAPLVFSVASLGTLISAMIVGAGMHWIVGWGWQAALLFGSLIAATDPVSVIALMKEQNAAKRLRFLMESESLLNDGVAAVMFALVVGWIEGRTGGAGTAVLSLVTIAGGGALCGLLVAGALLLIAGRSDDHLVEITLTIIAAYGSFLIAERLQVSGVLATLTAGMLVGNWGRGRWLTSHGGEAIGRFWDVAAFLANSIVFLLIGSGEAVQGLRGDLIAVAAAIGLVLVGRAAAIYPIAAMFRGTIIAIDRITQHILFWGGLRGALALALALATPSILPEREVLIAVTFAVVAFSIFVQGLTVPSMLKAAAKTAG